MIRAIAIALALACVAVPCRADSAGDFTFVGSASGAGVLPYTQARAVTIMPSLTNGVVDTTGYNAVIYQATTPGSGYTWAHQFSNDASTWVGAQCTSGTNGISVTSAANSASPMILCPAIGRYFRLNVTGGTGAIVAWVTLKNSSTILGGYQVTQGSPTSGWGVAIQASAAGGANATRVVAANTTNASNLKNSAATAYSVTIASNAASKVWVHLFNKAAAPTCSGTPDTPLWSGAVDAVDGKSVTFNFGPVGLVFGTGIGLCITTDATATTAVAAGAAVVTVGWK